MNYAYSVLKITPPDSQREEGGEVEIEETARTESGRKQVAIEVLSCSKQSTITQESTRLYNLL